MNSNWSKLSLAAAGVELIDCVHKTPKEVENGIPYIGIPQMKEGRIDFAANPRLISAEDFIEWTRKALPQEHDVVLSRRTNPGVTAPVTSTSRFALGQNLVLLRSNGKKIYPPFLKWLVQGPEWWVEIEKYLNVGAVFNSLKCRDIPNFVFSIPPMEIQRGITTILDSLVGKIETNRISNDLMESIAQTIFKSWFVDFDPVRAKVAAKANGEDPQVAAMQAISGKSVEELQQLSTENYEKLASTTDLFPDKMEETEYGEIPDGWEWKKLEDVVEVKYGKDHKKLENGEVPCYGSGGIMRRVNKSLYDKESVLIPRKGTLNNVMYVSRPFWSVDTMFYTKMKQDHFAIFFYHSMCQYDFKEMNVGSAVPSMTTALLKGMRILIPNHYILQEFDLKIHTLYDLKDSNAIQSQKLSQIRDSLLPELLSGSLNIVGR